MPKVVRRQSNRNAHRLPLAVKFLILLLCFLGISIGIVYGLKAILTQWPFLMVKNIECQTDGMINTNEVVIRLSEFKQRNLYDFLDDEIFQELSDFYRIKRCIIRRIPPSRIAVLLSEHEGIGRIYHNDKEYLMDAYGKIIDIVRNTAEHTLPLFVVRTQKKLTMGQYVDSKEVQQLLQVYRIIVTQDAQFLGRIEKFCSEDNKVVIIENKRHVRYLLGKKDFDSRVEKMIFADRNFGVALCEEIDLRFSDPCNELIILR